MFGATRSRRRSSLPPCPCNNTCRCHRPSDGKAWKAIVVFIATWVFVIGIVSLYVHHIEKTHTTRYIEVDGKMCVVKFKETGHTVTGSYWGHDIADCNGKEKPTTN